MPCPWPRWAAPETLGGRIAAAILERFPGIHSVRVCVRKPAAPIAAALDHAGIEVTRLRRSRVALSLGSNIGDKDANLRLALAHLHAADGLEIDAVSRFYNTAPWGKADQDWFLNACATGWSTLAPEALLKLCKRIELAIGRVPGARWGPRVIDIDLLHMDDLQIDTPILTLPHREFLNRAFGLEPLAEIAPDLRIWRTAPARELVFGASHGAPILMTPGALRDVEASRVRGHQDPPVDLASPDAIRREHLAEAKA